MSDRILTVEQAAEILSLSERQLYRAAREGRCPFRKVEGRWRIYESALHEWFAAHPPRQRNSLSADPMAPQPRRTGGSFRAEVYELDARRRVA